MVTLLAKLKPIEDSIIDLMAEKAILIDQISVMRRDMVQHCIHPYTHLTAGVDNTTVCKFCEKKFSIKNITFPQ